MFICAVVSILPSMTRDIRKHISNRIRELRAKRGLTQQKLAEEADVDYKTVQRLEGKTPHRHPNIDTLEKIARALEVTVSELLKS